MAKTLRIMDRTELRQKGWWLFGFVVGLQVLFLVGSYLLQSSWSTDLKKPPKGGFFIAKQWVESALTLPSAYFNKQKHY